MSFGVMLLVLMHRWDSPATSTSSIYLQQQQQPFSYSVAQLYQLHRQLQLRSSSSSPEAAEVVAASRLASHEGSYRWIEAGRKRAFEMVFCIF